MGIIEMGIMEEIVCIACMIFALGTASFLCLKFSREYYVDRTVNLSTLSVVCICVSIGAIYFMGFALLFHIISMYVLDMFTLW